MVNLERRIEVSMATRRHASFSDASEAAREIHALGKDEEIMQGEEVWSGAQVSIELPEFKGLRVMLRKRGEQEHIELTCGGREGRALRNAERGFGVSADEEGPADFFITDIEDPEGLLDRSSGWVVVRHDPEKSPLLVVHPEIDKNKKPKGTAEQLNAVISRAEAKTREVIEGILSGNIK